MAAHDTDQTPPRGPVQDPGLRYPPFPAGDGGHAELLRTEPTQPGCPPATELQVTELEAWEKRLLVAEEDLRHREQQALAGDATPSELLALAAEHDMNALDRDTIATSYDERATGRDRVGLGRDVAGSGRDRAARAVAKDRDAAFADRSHAGQDRDQAAGDRGDSYDDRVRGRKARERAAEDRIRAADERERASELVAARDREVEGLRAAMETRLIIGQAQGMLMARHNLSTEAAFALLAKLSQNSNIRLRDVAVRIVADFTGDFE